MSPLFFFLLFLLFIRSSAAAIEAVMAPSDTPTPYSILQSHNFPVGLLPVGAKSYDFDPNTGDFAVFFDGSCSFTLQGSYQLRYQPKITGHISQNKIRDLKGISVKVLLFWVNIIEVDRIGDNLEFSVGIASADFPIENFYECPKCGCGVDCVNGVKLRGSF